MLNYNDYVKHPYLIILAFNQSQFELVLGGVNIQYPGLTLSIQTIDTTTLDSRQVDWDIQSTDYTIISTTMEVEKDVKESIKQRHSTSNDCTKNSK